MDKLKPPQIRLLVALLNEQSHTLMRTPTKFKNAAVLATHGLVRDTAQGIRITLKGLEALRQLCHRAENRAAVERRINAAVDVIKTKEHGIPAHQ